MRRLLVAVLTLTLASCQKSGNSDHAAATGSGSAIGPHRSRVEQVPPPYDLQHPPADAVTTADGLIYKKEVTNDAGEAPKRNDTVMINYTGWKQSTGETFFTNRTAGRPMPLNLSTTAPGFTEALQLMKKGEKAVLWVPPSIGFKTQPVGKADTYVYEVELVDIQPAPPVPADLAAPPANALTSPKGTKYEIVKPATGTAKAKPWDTVTYHMTAWDSTGRMFETTEMRKTPRKMQPYKQPEVIEDVVGLMTAGERVRFWTTPEKIAAGGRAPAGVTGDLVYEIELITIEPGVEPPPVPKDVAKPPADAKKTDKGVYYKLLSAGPAGGVHPKVTDTVKVNFTGWTTDGHMFDSSIVAGKPAEFSLQNVIAGWTDGIPQMAIGDKMRFWIPQELAYKGQPGRPQGMLVFDVELLEAKATPPRPMHGPHGMMPGMPGMPSGHPPMPGMPGMGHPALPPRTPPAPIAPPPAPAPAAPAQK